MTQSNPLVSIIVNCFNGDEFLKEAMDSIYSQTFIDWEIIFWDNASSDESANIAKSYDERVKYYRASKKTSLGKARSLAVEKSSGKYLAFLDCDDLWLQHKLEKQIDLISNKDVVIVYGSCEIFYENKRKKNITVNHDKKLPEGMIFSQLVCEDFIPFPSILLNKEKFLECGGFPTHFKHSTDYWVLLHLSYKYQVRALQEVCCRYRIHESNLSHSQHVVCSKENIELIKLFLPDK